MKRWLLVAVGTAALMLPLAPRAWAASGSLKVTSFPSGAQVWVDGVDTGKVTPMSISLSEGDHIVTVQVPTPGWNPDTRTVTVVSGNNDLSVTLLPITAAGTQGPKGDKGDPGAQGPKGDTGQTGAQGPKGDKGDAGEPGPKGDRGDTGAQGPQGETGATGATGEKGDKGDKGDPGEPGVPGTSGDVLAGTGLVRSTTGSAATLSLDVAFTDARYARAIDVNSSIASLMARLQDLEDRMALVDPPSGNYLWSLQMTDGDSNGGYATATDSQKNVLVTGEVGGDLVVAKFAPDGTQLWLKRIGGIGEPRWPCDRD